MPVRLARPSKYRAVRTTVDNIAFASKAEARRYGELKLLEKAGKIAMLELQPKIPLHAGGSCPNRVVGHYRGDFSYYECDTRAGKRVIEDVKGMDTPLSKWKRKHVKAQYGIDVQLVRYR